MELPKRWIYQVFAGRWEYPFPIDNFWQGCLQLQWDKLSSLGCHTVYFLGIWDHRGSVYVDEEEGVDLRTKNDRVPSMMAIRDHTSLDPQLGCTEDFKKLVDTIQRLGMKVIVDFVPNHTNLEHPWIEEHPDWYVWNNGELVREFSGDVAKLNYEHPDLVQAMTNVMTMIAQSRIDGVRVDMAHLIPTQAWETIIGKVKADYPDFTCIAEVYPRSQFDYGNIDDLLSAGFDAFYDAGFYSNINRCVREQSSIRDLVHHMSWITKTYAGKNIGYISNHDDPPLNNRNQDESVDSLFITRLPALLAITLFTHQLPLIYNGTLFGYPHRLAHHFYHELPITNNELLSELPFTISQLFNIYYKYKSGTDMCLQESNSLIEVSWNIQNHTCRLITNITNDSLPSDELAIGNVEFSHGYDNGRLSSGGVLFCLD